MKIATPQGRIVSSVRMRSYTSYINDRKLLLSQE